MKHFIAITPKPKPRMTQRDKYMKLQSNTVKTYFEWCNAVKVLLLQQGLRQIPDEVSKLYFFMPMPKSWSKKMRKEMEGQLHKQTPDLDNMLKALLDAMNKDDKSFSHVRNGFGKIWSESAGILIETL